MGVGLLVLRTLLGLNSFGVFLVVKSLSATDVLELWSGCHH